MPRTSPQASSSPSLYTHVRGFFLAAPWLLSLLTADVILSLLLPLKPFAPRFVYDASSAIAGYVWAWIQGIFISSNGARIVCSGDAPLPRGESAIVISNHVAWADFYMIQELAAKSGMLGRCRYFAKKELRVVPFLGWGLWAMGMPMVSRNWLRDQSELDKVFSTIVKEKCPTWLISFTEATRFTSKKYKQSQEWCAKTNRRQPLHLLYPRTKGFIATVQHLRCTPHIKAIYDLTVSYRGKDGAFQQPPTMWETLSVPDISSAGQGYGFHVHVRRYPIKDLPESDEELAGWLEERWVEKGEMLEAQRKSWAGEKMD